MARRRTQSGLDLDPLPPAGKPVHLMDRSGRPCEPGDAWMFTWEGASQWYPVKATGAPSGEFKAQMPPASAGG